MPNQDYTEEDRIQTIILRTADRLMINNPFIQRKLGLYVLSSHRMADHGMWSVVVDHCKSDTLKGLERAVKQKFKDGYVGK